MKGITLCTEEFAELIVALSKYLRYGDAILKSGNLYEEFVDVSLSIDYIMYKLNLSDAVYKKAKYIKAQRAINIKSGGVNGN